MPRIRSYHFPYQEKRYDLAAMELLEPYVQLTVQRYTVSGYDPDDLRQELRIHLWNKIHLYNPQRTQLSTWATTVLRNKMKNILRSVDDKRYGTKDLLDCWEVLLPLDDDTIYQSILLSD